MDSAVPQNISYVRLQFGPLPQNPMVNIKAAISICQNKQTEMRQKYSQFLGLQVPTNCVILQLDPNNHNAQELATFIMDSRFQDDLKDTGVKMYAVPNANKVYVLVQSEGIAGLLQSFGPDVVVEQQGEAANELSIKIKSDSEFNTFVDESKKLIYSTDFFNSLLFEAQLIKTKAMGLLLRNIVQNFLPDMQHFFAIYDKLKNLNLDLKHASARTLPNVLRNTAATEAVPTADYLKFMQLSELIDNTAQITVFSKIFMGQGSIYLRSFAKILNYL